PPGGAGDAGAATSTDAHPRFCPTRLRRDRNDQYDHYGRRLHAPGTFVLGFPHDVVLLEEEPPCLSAVPPPPSPPPPRSASAWPPVPTPTVTPTAGSTASRSSSRPTRAAAGTRPAARCRPSCRTTTSSPTPRWSTSAAPVAPSDWPSSPRRPTRTRSWSWATSWSVRSRP